MDVCLSAPTGSGKTLCYLIPALTMIAKEKKELNDTRLRCVVLVPTRTLGAQVYALAKRVLAGTTISVVSACGENASREPSELVHRVAGPALPHINGSVVEEENRNHSEDDEDVEVALSRAEHTSSMRSVEHAAYLYFSAADLLVITPQRLLKHLGSTPGFHLQHLRMLVIDEADQILSATGSFGNLVGRILRLCDERSSSNVPSVVNSSTSHVLHKILCSATLSTHMTRISEVRLRNCKHFCLDSSGKAAELVPEGTAFSDMQTSHVTNKFALPPGLVEHMLITTDEHRPALLLKLVRHVLMPTEVPCAVDTESQMSNLVDQPSTENLLSSDLQLPSSVAPRDKTSCGKTCVVFCGQSDMARVLSKFLSSSGVKALDFTSTSTIAERRQFVLSGISGRAVALVTTDALMRGVDLPGVGHVVMYDAPSSITQFVHRIGRTARALRTGHAYMLLSKKGPSGTMADGEVAKFKALDKFITRTSPVQYNKDLQQLSEEDIATAATKLAETQAQLQKAFSTKAHHSQPKQAETKSLVQARSSSVKEAQADTKNDVVFSAKKRLRE